MKHELNLTAISTSQLDQDIKDFLPSDSRQQNLMLLDELSRRLAADAAKAVSDYARAKNARDARTAEREAVVIRAVKDDLAVLKVTPPHKRTKEVRDYMKERIVKYGGVPTEDVIRRVLKERCVIQRPYSYFITFARPAMVKIITIKRERTCQPPPMPQK